MDGVIEWRFNDLGVHCRFEVALLLHIPFDLHPAFRDQILIDRPLLKNRHQLSKFLFRDVKAVRFDKSELSRLDREIQIHSMHCRRILAIDIDSGVQKSKIGKFCANGRNTLVQLGLDEIITRVEVHSLQKFLRRERLLAPLDSNVGNLRLRSRLRPERDKHKPRGLVTVVFGSDLDFEIRFRLQEFRCILDNSINRGRRKFFSQGKTEVAGKRPFEKICRLQTESTEEEMRLDPEREIGCAFPRWRRINLDVAILSGIVELLDGRPDVFRRNRIAYL